MERGDHINSAVVFVESLIRSKAPDFWIESPERYSSGCKGIHGWKP